MELIDVEMDKLVLSDELRRSGSTKQFEERLRSSIEEIGLAEPIKVAPLPSGEYLVVDGTLRVRAIRAIREGDSAAFKHVAAYVTDYARRYEIRYQTDIYQDLLPSQLASLVEHLAKAEDVKKVDIARYIGVSPATLRNYTGLWRLIQRGGLYERLVELMDVGVFPASNPFAWLRLDKSKEGLRHVLEGLADDGESAEAWTERMLADARQGRGRHFLTTDVETLTGNLDAKYYREMQERRQAKQNLGTRRGTGQQAAVRRRNAAAERHLTTVTQHSSDPVLQLAAASLRNYLQ